MVKRTFVIFTDIWLVIHDGDSANRVCAPLGSDSHGFRDFLIFLQVSTVSALAMVLSIIWDILIFVSVDLLLPLGHQQFHLVTSYDLQSGVGMRTSGAPFDVWTVSLGLFSVVSLGSGSLCAGTEEVSCSLAGG